MNEETKSKKHIGSRVINTKLNVIIFLAVLIFAGLAFQIILLLR